MTIRSRTLLLIASLAVVPTAGVLAQSTTNNSNNAGGMTGSQTPGNPHQPGATGKAIVKGDHSTVSGDKAATKRQKTGSGGTSGGR